MIKIGKDNQWHVTIWGETRKFRTLKAAKDWESMKTQLYELENQQPSPCNEESK